MDKKIYTAIRWRLAHLKRLLKMQAKTENALLKKLHLHLD